MAEGGGLDPDHPLLEEEVLMVGEAFEGAHRNFLVEGPVLGYRRALVQLEAVRHPVTKK